MKKVLETIDSPTYNTFNDLAFAFSVIDAQICDHNKWLLEHFLEVYYKKSWDAVCFKMPYCYKCKCFNSKMILYNSNNYKKFIESVKSKLIITNIYLCVNEKYLPQRLMYKKSDFIHNIYIYGYDTEKKFL